MSDSDGKLPGSEDRIRNARDRFLSRDDKDTNVPEPDPPADRTTPADAGASATFEDPPIRESEASASERPAVSLPAPAGSATQPWYTRRWVRTVAAIVAVIALRLITSGSLVGGGEVLEMTEGECFNSGQLEGAEETVEVNDVDVVSCDEPHLAEVTAVIPYDSTTEDRFPGVGTLNAFAIEECALAAQSYIATDLLSSGFDAISLAPSEEGWGAGDRTVQCAVTRLDGRPATGSAEGGGPIVPEGMISVFELNEGDCFDTSEWYSFGLPNSCAQPHDFEVYAVLTIPAEPGAPYSSVEQVAALAAESCTTQFARRVDPAIIAEVSFGPVAFPIPATWVLGHRSYVCGLFAVDASKLTGSRLLAHKQHAGLLADEFGDRQLSIDFEGFSDIGSLSLVGSAHQEGDVLAVTEFAEHAKRGVPFEQERPQRGAAWFAEPQAVDKGFVTAFVFQFEMYSWFTVGDGMAFVIQSGDPDALGVGIGYDGMPNSVAVEFDTLKEDWLEDPRNNVAGAPDLLGNHVSVQTRGRGPNDTHTDASLGWANLDGFYMADRAAHVALIVYEPGELRVFVDDFDQPALTVSIDLTETLQLDEGSKAYVGFTASSGPETSRGPRTLTITGHKVLAWEFAVPG